jgi:hypothetical protein
MSMEKEDSIAGNLRGSRRAPPSYTPARREPATSAQSASASQGEPAAQPPAQEIMSGPQRARVLERSYDVMPPFPRQRFA